MSIGIIIVIPVQIGVCIGPWAFGVTFAAEGEMEEREV